MESRHHLTLTDLMATVATAALATGDGIPPSVPPLVVIFWLTVPLVGIVWDRWRGCSGILGGALAGTAEAGFALIWVITGPHRPGQMGPSYLANNPIVVVFVIAGYLTFGTMMGVATWLVAAAMGRPLPFKVPGRDHRFMRQR
jgi:hypothetical protein